MQKYSNYATFDTTHGFYAVKIEIELKMFLANF